MSDGSNVRSGSSAASVTDVRPPDRWFGPSGSRTYHYFGDDLRSLCGKWMLWRDPVDVGVCWGVAIGNASGDCAGCKKKLAKLYPEPTS